MNNFLLFDADRSLASIGGDEGCVKHLGLPPVPVSRGLGEFLGASGYFNQVLENVIEEVAHPVFPNKTQKKKRIVANEHGREFGLNGFVLDTASTIGQQERDEVRRLREKEGGTKLHTLDRRGWGIYGDKMMRFWSTLAQVELTVIVNVHEKRDSDDAGAIVTLPAMKGSSATDMLRFFDVVLYTRVDRDVKTGQSTFRWQTKPDERRFAKDRLNLLDPMIAQDYRPVLDTYRANGVPHPKILCIGESGTGKTYALTTINHVDKEVTA